MVCCPFKCGKRHGDRLCLFRDTPPALAGKERVTVRHISGILLTPSVPWVETVVPPLCCGGGVVTQRLPLTFVPWECVSPSLCGCVATPQTLTAAHYYI